MSITVKTQKLVLIFQGNVEICTKTGEPGVFEVEILRLDEWTVSTSDGITSLERKATAPTTGGGIAFGFGAVAAGDNVVAIGGNVNGCIINNASFSSTPLQDTGDEVEVTLPAGVITRLSRTSDGRLRYSFWVKKTS